MRRVRNLPNFARHSKHAVQHSFPLNDPEKLLELKRLESHALLDVLRTVNLYELSIPQLCLITRNVLRAQLGVKRVSFLYRYQNQWCEGIRLNMPIFSDAALDELFALRKTTSLQTDQTPHLRETGGEFAVPILNRGEAVAYFVIADFAESEVEIENDLIFTETLGNILYVAIYNHQLFQERMAQEFLRKELEVAETIQRQLLISDFSGFGEHDIFAVNVPHHGIGGDFYDVIQKGDGVTFVCIGDVSGKGIGAALLMSNLQANLRALCARYDSPAKIVEELNAILYNISGGDKFVTLFLAGIDAHSHTITYVNAGHCYPIFLQADKHTYFESSCMLLGILPSMDVPETCVDYSPNDVLLLFTDGIVEQENAKGEMFGSEKILAELMHVRDASAQHIIEYLQQTLNEYAQGAERADDVTMLCVKG